MKGMELPINTLIVIVVAITILLAVIAIFFRVYNPSVNGINLETAKSNACQMLSSLQCSVDTSTIQVSNFDADDDGTKDPGTGFVFGVNEDCKDVVGLEKDNLAALCKCYYGIPNENGCKKTVCGCLAE